MPQAAALFLLALLAAATVAASLSAPANAALYKMVLCGANVGANTFTTDTNTKSAANPDGIFVFQNACGGSPYPAGNNAFLRILESQASGNAGQGAFGRMFWTPPPHITIAGGGGYTREPEAFNDGWRAMFWVNGHDASHQDILVQGTGVDNGSCGGVCWNTTSVFAPHLWPFGGYGSYRDFVFELHCVRAAGCDRAGVNAVDANSFQLILNDMTPPQAFFIGSAGIMSGGWVRGVNNLTWTVGDQGSGLRWERLRVDGGVKIPLDWGPSCNVGSHGATGEFARDFRPCPTGSTDRNIPFDTASLADGLHTMQICAQDYGQSQGLNGSGGENCDQRQIRTDNQPPGAPGGLAVVTSNPARYLDQFGARWTLPPDAGSPISKVHYNVVNAAGTVVVPEKVITSANPTQIDTIEGPKAPGDYRLRVWLEDSVGHSGPVSTVPIPRDTTPPAAPQNVSVTPPSTLRSADGFDVRWRNITDAGSPIDAVHYQVVDRADRVVVSTKDLSGDNPQAIQSLETPEDGGGYALKLWLSDAEGNQGAPVSVPLSYECVRSTVKGGETLTSGLGAQGVDNEVVNEGTGSTFGGVLKGTGGNGVGSAPVCVFSRVVTDSPKDFLGVALTDKDGSFKFPVRPGPSRELVAVHRRDHREVISRSTIQTIVHPILKARKKVIYNKHVARFYGEIPGPHNDRVVIVLQAKVGKGWTAFRRYRTRDDGKFRVSYRFRRTFRPTKYAMRAQVRQTVGYPYLQGNSRRLQLLVLPKKMGKK